MKRFLFAVTTPTILPSTVGPYDTYVLESASLTGPHKLVAYMPVARRQIRNPESECVLCAVPVPVPFPSSRNGARALFWGGIRKQPVPQRRAMCHGAVVCCDAASCYLMFGLGCSPQKFGQQAYFVSFPSRFLGPGKRAVMAFSANFACKTGGCALSVTPRSIHLVAWNHSLHLRYRHLSRLSRPEGPLLQDGQAMTPVRINLLHPFFCLTTTRRECEQAPPSSLRPTCAGANPTFVGLDMGRTCCRWNLVETRKSGDGCSALASRLECTSVSKN